MKQRKAKTFLVILYHEQIASRGGEEKYTLDLLKALRSLRIPTFLVVRQYVPNTTFEEFEFFPVLSLEKISDVIKFFAQLRKVLSKTYHHDKKVHLVFIILAPSFHPVAILLMLGMTVLFRAIILIRHGYYTLYFICWDIVRKYEVRIHPIMRILRFVFTILSLKKPIILNNLEAFEGLKQCKGLLAEHFKNYVLLFLPPSIDIPAMNVSCEDKLNDLIIAVIARISPEKRIHRALISFLKLNQILKVRHLDIRPKLHIVGDIIDFNYYHLLLKLTKRLGIEDKVKFLCGEKVNIINTLREATICWDFSAGAFGIANAEALTLGCIPIVPYLRSSSVGPYGVVYDDWSDVAKVTAEIITELFKLDYAERCELLKNVIIYGRKYVMNRYSISKFKERIVELFNILRLNRCSSDA